MASHSGAPDPLVAYVLAPDTDLAPAANILESASSLDAATAVHLCREVPAGADPQELPPAPVESAERIVAESWLAPAEWLVRQIDRGLDATLASRVIVRVDWPVSPAVETTLLLARLASVPLRLAVPLPAASAEDAFLYFDRMEFGWIALPKTIDSEWSSILARLSKLWCLDPRVRTPVEPIVSGFGQLLHDMVERPALAWRYVVVDRMTNGTSVPQPWSPSIHAFLLGYATAALEASHHRLCDSDASWMREFRALCPLDAGRLKDMLNAAAVAGTGGTTR